jgi:2-polyprenyl-3-methyl-5-hydroxy-6-metoxy-1,4-benzoquinol methylase
VDNKVDYSIVPGSGFRVPGSNVPEFHCSSPLFPSSPLPRFPASLPPRFNKIGFYSVRLLNLNNKSRNNTELMVTTYRKCPLCSSDKISALFDAKDHLLSVEVFTIYHCQSCDFVFTQGVPPAEEIWKYYQSEDYISHSDTHKGLMNKLYHVGRTFMLRKKFRMVDKVAKGNKLLDIGCGTGYFPAYMKQKGYQVSGVEADPKARAFAAKEFGFPVFSPEELIGKKIPGRFDVITLWHVLEHLDDFNLYLERMLGHLVPGGTLVIALPNRNALDARYYKEFWAGYDVPRHLWHFTPSTLKYLADGHGLKIVKMKRLMLDPFYNSLLSEKYRGNRVFMIFGIAIGKLAYIESLFDVKKSSSVVYILKGLETPGLETPGLETLKA